MMFVDPLYFPRQDLAHNLVSNLKSGILHALTLFAPRRMGKTMFLLNDVLPLAQEQGFHVMYYSFMDKTGDIEDSLTVELHAFLQDVARFGTLNKAVKKVKGVQAFGIELDFEEKPVPKQTINQLLHAIAKKTNQPVLLLLDEVQELTRLKDTGDLIRSLRTGLDVHRTQIKVIFTGSSTQDLRAMFNDQKAPFFHFSHALDFPHLDQAFTDFLATIYHQRTKKRLDATQLYAVFEQLNFTPMHVRTIVQDMIINPQLTLEQATQQRIEQLHEETQSQWFWYGLDPLSKALLKLIAHGQSNFYTHDHQQWLAKTIKEDPSTITASRIQGKLKTLERKDIISKDRHNVYQLNYVYI